MRGCGVDSPITVLDNGVDKSCSTGSCSETMGLLEDNFEKIFEFDFIFKSGTDDDDPTAVMVDVVVVVAVVSKPTNNVESERTLD